MKKIRIFALILALLMLTGCGAEGGTAGDHFYNESVDGGGIYDRVEMGSSQASPEKPAEDAAPSVVSQKLIRRIYLDAETDDLDALLGGLDAKIAALGGYAESRSVNGSESATRRYRYANLTIRVPADRLDEFVDHIDGASNILSSRETAEDITLSYVATQSRITALETEQTRLLELLAQAEDMASLLMIEERLTDVRTELEQVTSQLRLFDNLVTYATIELSVSEVQEFTPVEEKTIWQRIGTGFMDSLSGIGTFFTELFVFLVAGSPYIVLIGGVTVLVVWLIKRGKKQQKQKKPPFETNQNP